MAKSNVMKILPMFSLKCFIVSALIFRPLIHSELNFVFVHFISSPLRELIILKGDKESYILLPNKFYEYEGAFCVRLC